MVVAVQSWWKLCHPGTSVSPLSQVQALISASPPRHCPQNLRPIDPLRLLSRLCRCVGPRVGEFKSNLEESGCYLFGPT